MYLIRLDDASEYMNIKKWNRIEEILNKFNIKPIVGIIPDNKDDKLLQYKKNNDFWKKVKRWEKNDWTLAMHGHQHIYITENGGINPINYRSEFAGVDFQEQQKKIENGYQIMLNHGINPKIFFAPSHTFDNNTIKALVNKTDIRVISDTIANNIYYKEGVFFIPQQVGYVRKVPFKITTFCYHPNIMQDNDFKKLETFISKNKRNFTEFKNIDMKKRKKNLYDTFLEKLYFIIRKGRRN